jgi:hypothetical protein
MSLKVVFLLFISLAAVASLASNGHVATLHHEYGNHCAELEIAGTEPLFWKVEWKKYSHFKMGECPRRYTSVTKKVANLEGYDGVVLSVRFMGSSMQAFRDTLFLRTEPESCPSNPCSCCGGGCPCLCGGGYCPRCCH